MTMGMWPRASFISVTGSDFVLENYFIEEEGDASPTEPTRCPRASRGSCKRCTGGVEMPDQDLLQVSTLDWGGGGLHTTACLALFI